MPMLGCGDSGGPAASVATTVSKAGGDEQIAELGSQLALPVAARVTDQHGNGVQGVAVGWSATGATVSSPTVTSDASGVSSVNVTAGGTVGPMAITAVAVSNNLFTSNRNLTSNPAVDTVAVDGTVTWTWVSTGITTHSVAAEGSPSFTSSGLLTTSGQTYAFTFLAPGTYQYTCAVHPSMTGRVVVR